MTRVRALLLLSRDRFVAISGIALLTATAWFYLVSMAGGMRSTAMAMPHHQSWSVIDAGFAFVMWLVMMIAMMTPSAAPLVLTYARFAGGSGAASPRLGGRSAALVGGYLSIWLFFSMAATLLQSVFQLTGLLLGHERVTGVVAGVLLLVIGVWQLSPLKQACLTRCRSPMDFLVAGWRPGVSGAFAMGARHGAWCVGCCWALMLVLFVVGIMNLVWVAVITTWVLLEKTLPRGDWLGRAGGALVFAYGIWLIVTSSG